uniref:EB domain-containing protein n=1 Tax=Romanomermis culicivorax TaxID=13658 RepID=A0A915IGQ9_ROMCU
MLRTICLLTIFALYAIEAARTKQTARRLAPPTAICDVDEAPEIGKLLKCAIRKDHSTLKYYNEKCSNDTECFGGPNSMLCQNGVCQCAENFEPSQRFVGEKGTQTVCSSAPYLSNRCNATCQRPSTCLPYTGPGADGKVKVCQCAKPYVFQDGGCIIRNICVALDECSQDQFYDSTTYKCLPTAFLMIAGCKANEILVNTTCSPLANLADKCASDKQCLPSFSACTKGVCSCRDGFSTLQTSCVPKSILALPKKTRPGSVPDATWTRPEHVLDANFWVGARSAT